MTYRVIYWGYYRGYNYGDNGKENGNYYVGFESKWGFPKLGVPFLGVPIIRTIVFWGLYWGPLILGNYQVL